MASLSPGENFFEIECSVLMFECVKGVSVSLIVNHKGIFLGEDLGDFILLAIEHHIVPGLWQTHNVLFGSTCNYLPRLNTMKV